MTKIYYDALVNGIDKQGLSLKQVQAYTQKGYNVIVYDSYKTSEQDYNSIAINKQDY